MGEDRGKEGRKRTAAIKKFSKKLETTVREKDFLMLKVLTWIKYRAR